MSSAEFVLWVKFCPLINPQGCPCQAIKLFRISGLQFRVSSIKSLPRNRPTTRFPKIGNYFDAGCPIRIEYLMYATAFARQIFLYICTPRVAVPVTISRVPFSESLMCREVPVQNYLAAGQDGLKYRVLPRGKFKMFNKFRGKWDFNCEIFSN